VELEKIKIVERNMQRLFLPELVVVAILLDIPYFIPKSLTNTTLKIPITGC
jgi:hypothetical protein